MQSSLVYNRMTIKGGDTGHPVGSATNIGARWTVYTGPYTTRRGADGAEGRHFSHGETTYHLCGFRPVTDTRIGRHINWHDIPQPGVGWPSDVSPVAFDYNSYAETLSPPENADVLTIMYAGGCPGPSAKHTRIPWVFGQWNWMWTRIRWATDCTGSVQAWLTNSQRGASLGKLIDYANCRTIKNDPGLGDGVQLWIGTYATGYPSGQPDATSDHTAGHCGYSWQQVWDDIPRFVSTWGSALSTITLNHGTVPGSSIIVPNEIAAQISGGTPPPPLPTEYTGPYAPAVKFTAGGGVLGGSLSTAAFPGGGTLGQQLNTALLNGTAVGARLNTDTGV